MIESKALLSDLKKELSALEADLTERAEDPSTDWGSQLREDYERAKNRNRTGLSWIDWRGGEVSAAAVAWIIAAVFIRFCEDNDLISGAKRDGKLIAQPWIAAPGDGLERAVENESAFYTAAPTMTGRDWLQHAFTTLADLPAGRTLVDPEYSPVWRAPISASAADRLLVFFRRVDAERELVHDFADPGLDTRFLGDLYQDLSNYAKKTFALLQTPDFVEEFILEQTLTPAIKEFGLTGLKLIDPACGSGHFLLGAFQQLLEAWGAAAPGTDRGDRVQRALDSIHGVDLNPFAIAIARFRLTVAALRASGIASLVNAPAFKFHLAIGDSLLGGSASSVPLDLGDGEYVPYDTEDLTEYSGILENGKYHVVVANPPYIRVKDKALNQRYRATYPMCHKKYTLSVPFMELLFRLAKAPMVGSGAGYVGQITSNSFMTREFGQRLIEEFLSGNYLGEHHPKYVDLEKVIDSSRAWIPGHNSDGTPTVILVGRPQQPVSPIVRTVLGRRGEPGLPAIPSKGKVWQDMVTHLDSSDHDGEYVTVTDLARSSLSKFPWSLSGGGAEELLAKITEADRVLLKSEIYRAGFFGIHGSDDAFILTADEVRRRQGQRSFRPLAIGDSIRDWSIAKTDPVFFPYDRDHNLEPIENHSAQARTMWPLRTLLGHRATFGGGTYTSAGRPWYEWHQLPRDAEASNFTIAYAEVATHNHFILDPDGTAFKQTAPVLKLRSNATEDDHLNLLGPLNSSVASFWIRQVSYEKGGGNEPWEWRYQLNSTKLHSFPLPTDRATGIVHKICEIAQRRSSLAPTEVLASGLVDDLETKRLEWEQLGHRLVTLQEELDWQMYVAYGLADSTLVADSPDVPGTTPNQRAFEIQLARDALAGTVETSWFARHKRKAISNPPSTWPGWYRELIERRIRFTAESHDLRLLEQPEHKRRWAGAGWDELLASAVRTAIHDRLEAPDLWADSAGRPLVRSVAQIADELRHDEELRELFTIHAGSRDHDLSVELGKLMRTEATPAYAPLRYKLSGIEKFRAWEQTWKLQRAEDHGENVIVPIPPEFKSTDFLKASYWTARGKLDVPKERFISFPGSSYPEDSTAVYGWAGWDHSERGQAIARFASQIAPVVAESEPDQVLPLVGALIELQPWLDQWYDDMDARGIKPSTAIRQVTNSMLSRLGTGRDEVLAWLPPTPKHGRKRA